MVHNEGNTQCILLVFCSTPQVIEVLIHCGLAMQEMHIPVLLSEMLHYTHYLSAYVREKERSNRADCHMKGNREFMNLSHHVCTFPIFSVVYSHQGMADKVDNDCTEIFLIFFFLG